jgi:hypothetical protein
MIDFGATELTIITESLLEGKEPKKINLYNIAVWYEQLINLFPESIEQLKFAREWVELTFEDVKMFYYVQIAIYLIHVVSLYDLALYGVEEGVK